MFCPCDKYNYENLYDNIRDTNIHACPECGRPSNRFELTKGRWMREWEKGNPWTRKDWEVWKDPDGPPPPPPKGPENIVWRDIPEWLYRFLRKIGVVR